MASRVTLDSLGPEILTSILEYVDDTSPKTLVSASLVNKYLYSVSKLISGRHLSMSLSDFRPLDQFTTEIFDSLSENGTLLGNIRSISIDERTSSAYGLPPGIDISEYPGAWEAFADFIRKIGKLRTLTWNLSHPLSAIIVQTLEKHQKNASLRMFNYIPPTNTTPTAETLALSKSPALTHLRAVIKDIRVGPDLRELHFRTIVAGAPNLRYAGVVNYARRSRQDDQSLIPYMANFNRHSKPNASVKMLTLDGYDINRQTLNDWSTVADLSSLHNLKLSRGKLDVSYFQDAASLLPNLKDISLNFRHVHSTPGGRRSQLVDAACEYLKTCAPVEALSLWSWKDVISLHDILERHGATLKTLQLHERECASDLCQRQILNCDDITEITERCSKLESLTIDLRRTTENVKLNDNDENMKCFQALSRIGGRLSSLQIYFDAGILYLAQNPSWMYNLSFENGQHVEGEDLYISDDEPETGASGQTSSVEVQQGVKPTQQNKMLKYVKDIWQVVYGRHRAGSRTLTVKVGEWESAEPANRGAHQHFSRMGNIEQKLVRKFVAKPMERDDEGDKCNVEVIQP